ncbi:hypothetical protein [Aestuariivivens sediminis]|uniref:hypothetical protein n=1 Tax=Aestuariivivens sediminis TaxID=2913557 RepID=UPI001F579130|nr:hypothetical protein [Aestuariivivens sediminis]
MKRREFIPLSGLGISAIVIPTYYYKFYTPEYDPLLTEPELLSNILDGTTIRNIGEIYRKQFSDENSERKLAKLLSDYASTESTTTIEMLRQQIAVDYDKGNTVMVDGWILSRTEARQCALFSLTQTD